MIQLVCPASKRVNMTVLMLRDILNIRSRQRLTYMNSCEFIKASDTLYRPALASPIRSSTKNGLPPDLLALKLRSTSFTYEVRSC